MDSPPKSNPSDSEKETTVTSHHVEELFSLYSTTSVYPDNADKKAVDIMQKVIELMKMDYQVSIIDNSKGNLCGHYPSQIIHLESELLPKYNVIYEHTYDKEKLRSLQIQSRYARCRTRFPTAVILYKGRYILRSSTLSNWPETSLRSMMDYWIKPDIYTEANKKDKLTSIAIVREWDANLLKEYKVKTIIDFMVEKNKVKYGVNVTSSEKAESGFAAYRDFVVLSMPYPGCEFFTKFRRENYEGMGLKFDWSQDFVDTEITSPPDSFVAQLNINWTEYKNWDLITITKNYLKLILKYLDEQDYSILIHCISGWDRTPLFVSLIRISLWADGLIHTSLSTKELFYLTVAYDWMLFGHQLPERHKKGEDIFYFCFHMLKYIDGDEFSNNPIHRSRNRLSSERSDRSSSSSRECNGAEQIAIAENMIFDMELRGSNTSLCSNSSNVSTKSQDPTGEYDLLEEIYKEATRSPLPRRPSPDQLSNGNKKDTNFNCSNDNWQMITGTGSLRETVASFLNEKYCKESETESNDTDGLTARAKKLYELRQLANTYFFKYFEFCN